MIQLAGEVFDAQNDPGQLQVDESVINKLIALHPASVSELDEGEGPVVWILMIPTTNQLMEEFLKGTIGEQEMLDQTSVNGIYDCIYLCSAMVLEEYRGKGIASKMILEAIHEICKDHPINYLFVWPFTKEGMKLAERLSAKTGIPLKLVEKTK
jgi:GNAT superfamily N-acetyltransferase